MYLNDSVTVHEDLDEIKKDALTGANCFIKDTEQICVYGSKETLIYRNVLLEFKACLEYYKDTSALDRLGKALGVTVIRQPVNK